MAGRNLLVPEGKTARFRSIQDIMKDPNTKAKLTNLVDEAVREKLKIQQSRETINAIRDVAKDELSLNPKLFNYYVGAVYNNDYAARKESLDEMRTLIEMVMGLLPLDDSNYDNDE